MCYGICMQHGLHFPHALHTSMQGLPVAGWAPGTRQMCVIRMALQLHSHAMAAAVQMWPRMYPVAVLTALACKCILHAGQSSWLLFESLEGECTVQVHEDIAVASALCKPPIISHGHTSCEGPAHWRSGHKCIFELAVRALWCFEQLSTCTWQLRAGQSCLRGC